MREPVKEQLKKLRKARSELKKKEKELKFELAIESNIGKWKKIMDVRTACKKIVEDADLGMNMSLTKLELFPDYYVYQHPTKKKLKTDNRDEDWVKMYIGEMPMDATYGGATGEEIDLIATARKTRLNAWKRALSKKTKKKITTAVANRPEGDQVGVIKEKRSGFFGKS